MQVDRVLKELSSTQSTLAYVSGAIRDYEANAKPLLEAMQSQDEATRSEAAVISEVTLTLDHLLRKVGAAQAALPAIGRGSDPGPAGILSQLQEIDPATQVCTNPFRVQSLSMDARPSGGPAAGGSPLVYSTRAHSLSRSNGGHGHSMAGLCITVIQMCH